MAWLRFSYSERRRDQEDLRRHHGLLTARPRSAWRHWREPYLLALALNLLFTGLYLLEPNGLGGSTELRTSFAEAFFFSVQTLGSIGYGRLHPLGLLTNLVVTAESLTGLLFVAITTGAAFARFARSTARIRFSQQAVVHPYDGVPTLSFRLANERGTILREPRLRAYLAVDEVSREGHRLRRLRPLRLEREEGAAFLLVWTAMHRIDDESPLHAQASWPVDQVRFGACFADMVSLPEQGDERRIDWSAFDQLRACPLI